MLKVTRGLDALERKVKTELDGKLNIGAIATACMMGYLAFRLPDFFAQKNPGHLKLYAWYDKFSRRPSMIDTAPYEEPR